MPRYNILKGRCTLGVLSATRNVVVSMQLGDTLDHYTHAPKWRPAQSLEPTGVYARC